MGRWLRGIRNLRLSSHSLAIRWSAASEVLLLIWEGQPRHACQAHWGMDSTQQRFRISRQLIIRRLLLHPSDEARITNDLLASWYNPWRGGFHG